MSQATTTAARVPYTCATTPKAHVSAMVCMAAVLCAFATGCGGKPPPESTSHSPSTPAADARAAAPATPEPSAAPVVADPGVTHDLESTRWVLTHLRDQTITISGQQREPFFALNSVEHRVAGYGGCNRLSGGYQLDGERLSFTQLASTRMSCADAGREDGFIKALEAAANWKITGAQLALSDATGTVIARFEARNL